MNIPVLLIEQFVSDEEAAPLGLRSPFLDVENKRLLCTNGHMATRQEIGVNENDVSGLIPVEAFQLARKEMKAIRKVMKKDLPDPWIRVTCLEDVVEVENLLTNTRHLVNRPKLTADIKYPAVDAVFPDLPAGPSVSLSVPYLRTILAAFDGETASLWVGPSDAAVVFASPLGQATVVLMPQRVNLSGPEVTKRGAPSRG